MNDLMQFLSGLPWSEILSVIGGGALAGGPAARVAVKAKKGKSAAEREKEALERQLEAAIERAEKSERDHDKTKDRLESTLYKLQLERGRS